MKMSGALQAKVSASAADGKQAVAVNANSDRMSVGANKLEGLKVDLKIGDLWGARSVSGLARLARAEVAGQSVSDIKLTATGQGNSSDLDFSGSGRGLAFKASGRLRGGSPIRLDLAQFTAQGAGRTIALASPATLSYGKDGLAIQNFTLRVDSGRLSLSGRAGSTLDLRATAAAVPLAALDLVSPGLGASGTADGEATIGGTPGAPSGDWRVRLRQLSLPQTRSNALPPLDIIGAGRLAARTELGRRHRHRGRRQFPSRNRIGAAFERRRAGSQARRQARRRSRQHRLVPIRPSHDRRSHTGARIARDHR